ncbi:MAG TPA: hypothetical protein VLC09_10575 [Polyangiaceae bacterium]|nr:hypothetical protein [Polyangiaceae bacterium]
MRADLPIRRLSFTLAALLGTSTAFAQEAEESPAPAEAKPPAADSEEEVPDVNTRAGYIPGYRRAPGLGLSPLVPRTAARSNGTIAYHAPSTDDNWTFKFTGFASASLRLSAGGRDDPTADQSGLTVQAAPRTPDFYGAFNGTNATPGSWVDLHFQYGNARVQSHVTLTTWKPARGADWTDVRSQNLIDQAYLQFEVPLLDNLRLNWTAGAFRNIYGGLGQYGAGQYNTIMIGMPYGVGETASFKWDLGTDYSVTLEHGIMGRLGKVPPGSGPTPFDSAQIGGKPSSWVNHAHLGLVINSEVPWAFSLHYLNNWSQDERDQVDDPQTYWINESNRPDGNTSVYGFEARMLNNHWGNAAMALAMADVVDGALLSGMGFFGTSSGEELTKRFIGQRSGGNGKMYVAGFEYNLSWAKLLAYPESFWGEGEDLITSVFATAGTVQSRDPDADGRSMIKFGSEITYRWLSWLGFSARYDHVVPNSKDGLETFDVISPKILLRSDWLSHEQVTISYTKWFYGQHTHAEFPFEMPRDELDDQMFAIHFGMWW